MNKLIYAFMILSLLVLVKVGVGVGLADDITQKGAPGEGTGTGTVDKTIEGIDISKIENNRAPAITQTQNQNQNQTQNQQNVKTVEADIDDSALYKVEGPSSKSYANKGSNSDLAKDTEGVREVANINEGRSSSSPASSLKNGPAAGVVNRDLKSPDYSGVMWEYDNKKDFKPNVDQKVLDK
ncbi:MAG: hypothetical protein HQK49_01120 [Oligoflexia bacterium]|nr:hypothetical protein [Oligoflexia bacterium]